MPTLKVFSPGDASRLVQAFERVLELRGGTWEVRAASYLADAQVPAELDRGAWDAVYADASLAGAVRFAAKVQAASVQLSHGADLLFAHRGSVAAVSLFGAAAVAHLEREGYAFGGSHVAVCGSGPCALALVQALAQAGAERIVLVGADASSSEKALRGYLARYRRLAGAAIDIAPEEESHRSFAEAFRQPRYQFGGYATSTQAMATADYLMAAGAKPFLETNPLPQGVMASQLAVYHAGFAPEQSAFLQAAQKLGCTVPDGRGALACAVAQAASVLAELKPGAGSSPKGATDVEDGKDSGGFVDSEDLGATSGAPCMLDRMFVAAAAALGMTC